MLAYSIAIKIKKSSNNNNMGAVIEVKYFNTFILKKLCSVNAMPDVDPTTIGVDPSIWAGSYGIPVEKQGFGNFKGKASAGLAPATDPVFGYSQPILPPPNNAVANWSIEESRIRGGYNNTSVSFGPKAYLVEEEPQGSIRGNAMIIQVYLTLELELTILMYFLYLMI